MNRGRILVTDDHPLVREALQICIRIKSPNITVEIAQTIEEAEKVLSSNGRDYALILLDYMLPDSKGFSGFFRLRHIASTVPIAIISANDDDRIISASRAVGACGFLSKTQPLDELASIIERLLAGESVFPNASRPAPGLADMKQRMDTLSKGQKRVLAALVSGDLNKQIAADLDVSEAAIKAHLTAIFRKLGVHNRLQAILAVRPLLEPDFEP